jgi:hypothetical protein
VNECDVIKGGWQLGAAAAAAAAETK